MYSFTLPNKALINIDLLVDTLVNESQGWPQAYVDTRSGVVISVANDRSLKAWQSGATWNDSFIQLKPFSKEEKATRALGFVRLILQGELTQISLAAVTDTIKRFDFDAFEDYLETETDGFIHAWDQYIHDEVYEYISHWLLTIPKVKITKDFEGCGNCEMCKVMKQNPNDMSSLFNAFATEEVMQSVEKQIQNHRDDLDIVLRETPRNIFVFKISLNDSRPLIWRRVVMPDNYTFFELHCAIQDAMGWMDGHLHDFRITDTKSGTSIKEGTTIIALPDPESESIFKTKNERTELLKDWFGPKMRQCIYEYDFGDSWDHTVLLEEIKSYNPKVIYPQCLTGANACPPEDCGGIGGYEHLKRVLKRRKGKEYNELLNWLDLDSDEDFKPDHFDPAEVEFCDPNEVWQEYQSFRGYT